MAKDPRNDFRPEKLRLQMAAALLCPVEWEREDQLYALFQYQRDIGLKIRLGGASVFEATEAALCEFFQEEIDNKLVDTVMCSHDSTRFCCERDEVFLGNSHWMKVSQLVISTVMVKDVLYYISEEIDLSEEIGIPNQTQQNASSLSCNLNDAYITKDDLAEFLDKPTSKVPEWKNKKSTYFAPLMLLIEQAHEAIMINGFVAPDNPGPTTLDNVHAWLSEHERYKDKGTISDNLAKNIATIIANVATVRKYDTGSAKTGDTKKKKTPTKRKVKSKK